MYGSSDPAVTAAAEHTRMLYREEAVGVIRSIVNKQNTSIRQERFERMDLEYLTDHLQYPLRSYLRNPSHIAKNILWRWQSERSEKQHVFVVGAPRSGTTLLQVLIASHSRFCTWEGETKMFTWQNTFAANANNLGLDRSFVEQEFERQTNLVDFFDACVEQFRGTRSEERFVEKTPQHIRHTRFLANHFPNAHIVHIYRDGRDCYCSARRAEIPRGGARAICPVLGEVYRIATGGGRRSYFRRLLRSVDGATGRNDP